MAKASQDLGVHSVRPTLPERFLENFGYGIRTNTFDKYLHTYGMKELTVFLEDPAEAHRDNTIYPGGTQPSRLFKNLYEPIWNTDGSVNPNNYYANYVFKVLQFYGDKVRFWEVVNEPDFTYVYDKNVWLTRAPLPDELPNLRAPIFHYIRMLRISYEVIKKYRPDAYITTGGVGYPQFMDALLRYTDNPNGGAVSAQYPLKAGAYLDALSFHSYPTYSLHSWSVAINNFVYTRTSDYAIQQLLKERQDMVNVMAKYGYGSTYPAKHLLMSEANVSRRTSANRTASDEGQRNFGIKALVLTQVNAIKQFYFYQLGESVNAPPVGTSVSGDDELALMGLYENLKRDAPGSQKSTQLGQAFATTSKLLYGWHYDAARTAALALPSSLNGAAFSKNGVYTYVLWARALVDNQESARGTYSFPSSFNLTSLQRYEWNHASTNARTTISAQNVALTETPLFFSEGSAPVATTPTTTPTASTCPGTGSLTREEWTNIMATGVSAVPVNTTPNSIAPITSFETPSKSTGNHAARIRGYICAPFSGAYTFWITADDAADLFLSTSDDPTKKVRIASCAGWTSGNRDFTTQQSQMSISIQLQAGTRYYVEALHKQNWGAGYLAVAWRLPNGTRQVPVPGENLIPFGTATTTPTTTPTTTTPTPTPTPTTSACGATGSMQYEVWNNVNSTLLSSIPTSTTPNSTLTLGSFETPSQTLYNHGARARGYICAPATGAYTFSIVGDDAAELYLSTDADPAKKVRIASCAGWTSGNRDFTRYPSQQSATIQLQAGTRYYIEALHHQSWGPGYLAVAWRLPNGTRQEPIPGANLMPFDASTTPTTTPTPTPTPTPTGCSGTGSATYQVWNNVNGTAVSDIPTGSTPSSSSAIASFEAPTQTLYNHGARVQAYLCVPTSGAYTFWVVGDDAAELYLSTDADPAKKVRIASCAGWT
ncbi:PA14 domain-containing protein, partial [Hymenobacter sp. B1770]|uniref:PA14 domain-containing protein n=1 Tax=Hymenobacter sp. B1770 TaxID=1718788 RepID=UPI003CE7CACB